MAIKVEAYQSIDNSLWHSKTEAEIQDEKVSMYNKRKNEIDRIMAPLGPVFRYEERGQSCDFENGMGYVQHKIETILDIKRKLIKVGESTLKWWYDDQKATYNTDFMQVHPSWFLRLLDGSDISLEKAWSRLACIDNQGREWGQQYYANNPDKAPNKTCVKDYTK